MSLNNISIAKRLAIVLGLIVALSLGGGLLAIAKFRQQDRLVNQMMTNLQVERATSEWYGVTSSAVMRATAIVMSGDKAMTDYFAVISAAGVKRTTELQKFIEQSMDRPDEKTQFEKVSKLRKEFLASKDEALRLKVSGDDAGAHKVFDERFEPISREYLASVKELADGQRAQLDAANTAAASQRDETIWELAGFGAVSVASALVLALWLVRSITGPLGRAQSIAQAIARLDLSQAGATSYSNDETGRLLQSIETMRTALTRSLRQVRGVADGISTASTQIASGNQDLSARTEVTASNLQETASSMEQITGAVRQSADAAAQANQLASSATQVARRGGDVVSQVVSTMEEINSSSKKIADIIGVIDGIAFQTNILALNAAVEAARAGEQGRGFAVVAGEVRSLAQRSAEAAKEIKSLIGTSVDKVETGSKLVQDAGTTMSEIVASVQRVTDIIGEISASASEQSGGIGQVGIAVQQLDQMTQQNAALVEESAAAAASLNEQARQLDEAIGSFKLAEHH